MRFFLQNVLAVLMTPFWLIICIVLALSTPDETRIQPKEWAQWDR